MEPLDLKTLVDRLVAIGLAISSEHDLSILLEMIVDEARRLTQADGGTLFLVDEAERVLRWAIVQNETMGVRYGGRSTSSIDEHIYRPIPLFSEEGTPALGNVATYVVHQSAPVTIDDVYDEHDAFDFAGPLRFDAQTGYRTRSMMVVPLVHFEGGVVGVLQLINARDPQGQAIPFHPELERFTTALASQAAVAVKNSLLFLELEAQFEAFIQSIATAIDAKSAYTAGHVRRVVQVAMSIAEAIDRDDHGPFAGTHFSPDQLKALRIASWMHDVGKIATPEYVVDKATKLETIFDRIELIRTRYDALAQQVERDGAQQLLDAARRGELSQELETQVRRQVDQRHAQLKEELSFITRCNRGAEFMADHDLERLRHIAQLPGPPRLGEPSPRLTEDELLNLSVRRGTLNSAEIEVIRDHALISYRMLTQLPFSRHLADVPEIAAGHHEKLNGKGYPRGLTAAQLSLPARILAVADIFEALTAADRPYKRPSPLSQVKRILDSMVKEGELDPDVVRFAMQSGVLDAYAAQEVTPAQLDLRFADAVS